MANVNTKAHVLVRDHFTCRFCGKLLILAQPVKLLDWYVPSLELWDLHGKREPLRTRWATVDHIKSEKAGGFDVLENLAACCVSCNSRKGHATVMPPDEGTTDQHWDGLAAIFVGLAPQYEERLSTEDHKWLAALRREGIQGRTTHLEQVVEVLEQAKGQGPEALDRLIDLV